MKPVIQEIFFNGEGDCFSAALASILELPLHLVPKFCRDYRAGMMDAATRWLAEEHGLSLLAVYLSQSIESAEDLRIVGAAPGTPCIAAGKSPNTQGRHAVVGQITANLSFLMTHDPHPSGYGLAGAPDRLYFLVPLHPEVKRPRTRPYASRKPHHEKSSSFPPKGKDKVAKPLKSARKSAKVEKFLRGYTGE